MKFNNFAWMLVLCLCLTACGGDKKKETKDQKNKSTKVAKKTDEARKMAKKRLTKKWRLDFDKTLGADGLSASMKTLYNKKSADEKTAMKTEMEKYTLHFKADGTYENVGTKNQKGSWDVSENGKSIKTKDDESGQEGNMSILELTDDKLVIDIGPTNETVKLVLVAEKL